MGSWRLSLFVVLLVSVLVLGRYLARAFRSHHGPHGRKSDLLTPEGKVIITQKNIADAVQMYSANKSLAIATWGPIEFWDTSRVTDMSMLFFPETKRSFIWKEHEQKLRERSGWKLHERCNPKAKYPYWAASWFNEDISRWDTSNVVNMSHAFHGAGLFDKDISGWDTSKVKSFEMMFRGAMSFNANISRWDTSSGENFQHFLYYAFSFRQNLSHWDVSKAKNTAGMFKGVNWSPEELKVMTAGWGEQQRQSAVSDRDYRKKQFDVSDPKCVIPAVGNHAQ